MERIFLLLTSGKHRLTDTALERLSYIFADVAQISLGLIVVPAFVDKSNSILIVWGLVATVLFWTGSMFIAQNTNG